MKMVVAGIVVKAGVGEVDGSGIGVVWPPRGSPVMWICVECLWATMVSVNVCGCLCCECVNNEHPKLVDEATCARA